MTTKTMKANVATLAGETEVALQQLRSSGAAVEDLREHAGLLLAAARLAGVTIPFPLEREHPTLGEALRIQYMNGEPQPLATIWVRL